MQVNKTFATFGEYQQWSRKYFMVARLLRKRVHMKYNMSADGTNIKVTEVSYI